MPDSIQINIKTYTKQDVRKPPGYGMAFLEPAVHDTTFFKPTVERHLSM